MRELEVSAVSGLVSGLVGRINLIADPEVMKIMADVRKGNGSLSGRLAGIHLDNAAAAAEDEVPVCQDTGMTVVFLEVGQDVHLVGGALEEAVNAGVREGTRTHRLRHSTVSDPLRRVNTGDNAPAVIHTRLVPGDRVRVVVTAKGFGSENASALGMLPPSAGRRGVIEFVLGAIREKGADACPPLVVGVGIGGTMEKAALLAKEALTLPLGRPHPDPFYQELEREILDGLNRLPVGMQGLGDGPTAMAVHILTYPTHIAGLPVAVNPSCHVYRHEEGVL
ncbi:MAG TPA: fumarate hydratase [bacterium]|nr:fumarate hydratase [bacterium]HPQ67262.1 fumarate hydratase [bacterium]